MDCKHNWIKLLGKVKGKVTELPAHICINCGVMKIGKNSVKITPNSINMGGGQITNMGAPSVSTDATRKSEMDTHAALTTGVHGLDAKLQNVVDDTTPQLGGDLEYNEKHQVFDRTLTSDNTASGDIITVTFGESVVFGQLCYPDLTDNEWKLALATNIAVKHPAMGIALETKGDGQTGKLLLRGTIRAATYFSGAAMGDIIYLSDGTPGSVVCAAPGDSGDIVQIVGFGLETNYIYFNPDGTYVEIS